ncbi:MULTISPECIES: transposase [unclassified Streptomyces]|uniref:transposase n=1 Tax=unclassified Streptomyces TaxID=2593676 RepID=UPI0033B79A29
MRQRRPQPPGADTARSGPSAGAGTPAASGIDRTSPRGCLSDHRTVGPVVRDGEISAAARAVIAPLLPPVGRARDRWRDHRQVLEGIVFKFRTGLPWRDLPERFGPGGPSRGASPAGPRTALSTAC